MQKLLRYLEIGFAGVVRDSVRTIAAFTRFSFSLVGGEEGRDYSLP